MNIIENDYIANLNIVKPYWNKASVAWSNIEKNKKSKRDITYYQEMLINTTISIDKFIKCYIIAKAGALSNPNEQNLYKWGLRQINMLQCASLSLFIKGMYELNIHNLNESISIIDKIMNLSWEIPMSMDERNYIYEELKILLNLINEKKDNVIEMLNDINIILKKINRKN